MSNDWLKMMSLKFFKKSKLEELTSFDSELSVTKESKNWAMKKRAQLFNEHNQGTSLNKVFGKLGKSIKSTYPFRKT